MEEKTRIIVLTGASSGIGRETALRFARERDNRIYAVARNEKLLRTLSESARHHNIIPVPMDITDGRPLLSGLANRLRQEAGRLDILINNAGFLINKPFDDFTDSEVASTVAVNFTAPALLITEMLPLLHYGSHVVNIASMGGFQGSLKFPGLAWYSATKGALAVLTECLAAEYAEQGIIFNSICPGSVETDMFRQAFPGFRASLKPAEMADFIVRFALEGNRFFNGKILPVAVTVP